MISLAWHLLRKEKLRFLIGILGVAFGVVLMFMQFGFQTALFDSASLLHTSLNGEIFMIDPKSTSLVNMRHFSERRLCQALSSQSVVSVSPIYLASAGCRSSHASGIRRLFVIAFKPEENVFNIEGVRKNSNILHADDEVLFDELSRKEFGPIKETLDKNEAVYLEVAEHKLKVAGTFKLGTSFGGDGNIITSEKTFFRMGFKHTRQVGLIDIGLIKLKQGCDPLRVQAELKKALPSDVLILTRSEFINLEKNYWRQSTAVGFIFTIGVALGLVVGAVIVYQILYSDVNDHLSEYATLKAMGYSDHYLLDVILQESIILAGVGFFPGLMLSEFLYKMTRDITGLPMYTKTELELFVLALTIVMCAISAVLAAAKLRTADPAECF